MKRMFVHPKADDSWDKIYLYVEKTARVNREVILFDKPEELKEFAQKIWSEAREGGTDFDEYWSVIKI